MATARLPRALHPGAWWLWALGMAAAASRTTNPILLLMIVAVVAFVVSARRTDAPWARGFRAYVYLGLLVIAIRVVFRVLLDAQFGGHILFELPEVPLPEAVAGIRLGGPVSAEGVLAAVYDGLRLATLLLCVGAANTLANPKRLLQSMPSALHEIGVAVTVALSVAPQLIESGQRVRRARRLRGEPGRRFHVVREVALPVMTDALDRSLLLAAAMDSRGYGRVAARGRSTVAVTAALLLGGIVAIAIGSYGLLDSTAPRSLGAPDAPRRGRDRLGRGDAQRPARRAEPLPPGPVVDRGVGSVDRRLRGGVGDGGGERGGSHDPPPVAPAAALAGAARAAGRGRAARPAPGVDRAACPPLVVGAGATCPATGARGVIQLRPRHHHLRRRAGARAA